MKERSFLTPVTENFLHAYGVGKVAFEIALKFGVDPRKAFIAGCLHDLGGAVPASDRVAVAESLNLELAKEERLVPMLVHAKLGNYFAQALFNITDSDILNAILYHTTCIDDASKLVKIVFLADKIHWDRNGAPPYLVGVLQTLNTSLDEGCRYFLDWLWHDDGLYVVHPFLRRSYAWYFSGATFPVRNQNIHGTKLSEALKKKYFLNEIVAEFQHVFCMANEAFKLAQNERINANTAFLAAALVNITNTIPNNKQLYVARKVGIETNNGQNTLSSQLNYYFAKQEFEITDSDVLNATLHFQKKSNCNEPLCRVIANAYLKCTKN